MEFCKKNSTVILIIPTRCVNKFKCNASKINYDINSPLKEFSRTYNNICT